MQWSW